MLKYIHINFRLYIGQADPELGSASVLNQWENEGKTLTKWQLCRVVKELRKFRKHHRALQVKN